MRKRIFVTLVVCICLFLVIFHVQVLTLLADFLIIKDHLQKVDAIVVLSGDTMGGRVPKGVALFKEGYSRKIVMIGGLIQWNTDEPDIMKKHAIALGLKESDILVVNQGKSTYAQAKRMLEIMKNNNFKSAIVVTSNFHTRRARYIFKKTFSKNKYNLIVSASDTKRFNPSRWWKNSGYAKILFYEYTKLLWYWFRY